MPKFEVVDENDLPRRIHIIGVREATTIQVDRRAVSFSPIKRKFNNTVLGQVCGGCPNVIGHLELAVETEDGCIYHFGHRVPKAKGD